MTATFDFNSFDELDSGFLKRLKSLYRGKNIKVKLAIEEEDFSLNELLTRIEDIDNGRNVISLNEQEYQEAISNLTKAL
jgi:hypothetical protein